MKKTILSLALALGSVGAYAQEPALKAHSAYDVNQDNKVTVEDVTGVVNKAKAPAGDGTDQTVVDTQKLLEVLNAINQKLAEVEQLKLMVNRIAEYSNIVTDPYEMLDMPGLSVYWAAKDLDEYVELPRTHWAWGEIENYDKEEEGFTINTYPYVQANEDGTKDTDHYVMYSMKDGYTDGIWYNNGTYCGTDYWGKHYDENPWLHLEHDLANVKMGGHWRMPSEDEFKELIEACDWERTSTGVKGICKNNRDITIDFYCNGIANPYEMSWDYDKNAYYGGYWTSNLESTQYAKYCYFNTKAITPSIATQQRYVGMKIRPVRDR